ALVGRLRDDRQDWLISWTVAAAALCVCLGVIAVGHLIGFGVVTFRIYQLTGAVVAPLWLALGGVQLSGLKTPARCLSWLVGSAFMIIACVTLTADPIKDADRRGTSLRLGDLHWDVPPKYLITAAHGVVLVILLIALIVSLLRWRKG